MEGHLDESQRSNGNKRNGRGKKRVKSGLRTFEIDSRQERQCNFEPKLVKKRQTPFSR
ncbi:transposase [Gelidibacter salicanalis]